jgi:hypothetical protein
VRLSGATVGSNLECDSGSFDNPGGDALVAVGVIVKGSIFFRIGCSAKGEVRLFGATVGTNLECERASLDNADGNALVAEGINVKGHILLRNGFSAKGEVRLPGVTVGSVLALTGRFAGRLNLTDAHAVRLDLTGQTANWPAKGMLLLDGFTYREINRLDERQYLDWLRRLAPAAFHPQPYEQLSRVLRRSGRDKEARAIGIARYKDERPHLGFWARLWSRVRGAVVAHGYRPQQALLWTALLWLSGSWSSGGPIGRA